MTRDFVPHWLDFLAWDEPDGDTLWFDREKAGRKGVSVPNRAERIVVEAAHISNLWPELVEDDLAREEVSRLKMPDRLSPAPDREIRTALTAEYDQADKDNRKPPNVREVIAPVQERLHARGYEASGRRISELAGAEEFKSRRRKPGKTMASEKRRQQHQISR